MRTAPPDPRPAVRLAGGAVVAGGRCVRCGYPVPDRPDRCPECRGDVVDAAFGPGATVFSATTVHVALPGRAAPYRLAYVDLDDGPRILVHVADGAGPVTAGCRVELVGTTEAGDPLVRPVRPA